MTIAVNKYKIIFKDRVRTFTFVTEHSSLVQLSFVIQVGHSLLTLNVVNKYKIVFGDTFWTFTLDTEAQSKSIGLSIKIQSGHSQGILYKNKCCMKSGLTRPVWPQICMCVNLQNVNKWIGCSSILIYLLYTCYQSHK